MTHLRARAPRSPAAARILAVGCALTLAASSALALAGPATAEAGSAAAPISAVDGLGSVDGLSATTDAPPVDAPFVDGEVLVTWRDDTSAAARRDARDDNDVAVEQALPLGAGEQVAVTDGQSVADAVADLNADPRVESAQPNYTYARQTTDPYFGLEWGLHNTGQSVLGSTGYSNVDIDAPEAWATTKGTSSVVVAVIDTGVQINHPDIAPNVWTNAAEASGTPNVDDDGNGRKDDIHGWDFVHNDASVYDGEYCSSSYPNNDDHGTHVAGTIAARNDSYGVAGVAPNVKVMPIKILGCTSGTTDMLIAALAYAKAKGVTIANMSLGGAYYDGALRAAIESSGMLVMAAAGNGDAAYGQPGSFPSACRGGGGDPVATCPMYPAAFSSSNIISVAAVTSRGGLASFSQYGAKGPGDTTATGVDVGAPGTSILSTVPDGTGASANPGLAFLSGTSMAAPHVSGVAALVKSRYPSYSVSQVKARVLDSGRWISGLGGGRTVTGRLVNAANAVGRTSITAGTTASWVTYGGHTYVTGTLTSGVAVAGRTMQLRRYVPSSSTWVVDCTATTGADGMAVCKRYPSAHTKYQWRFAGDSTFLGGWSPVITVSVKAKISFSATAKTVKAGRSVTFWTVVAPNHAGKQVVLQKLVGSTWVTAASKPLSSTSKYAFNVKTFGKGTTYWRAYFPGDSDRWSTTSSSAKVVIW